MKVYYVYPGRFSPPTKGHFELVKSAAKSLPHVYVVCSTNPLKQDIFSTEESKELWRSYDLPKNVTLTTFEEMGKLGINRKKIVMVRGLRSYEDFQEEKIVMKLNKEQYGVDKFIYFFSTCGFEGISATKVRTMMQNLELEGLKEFVSPGVISALIEKRLNLKNIFLVVGRPGSGKSTFLNMLKEGRDDIVHINTDGFNKELKPLLKAHFGEEDLIKVALEREEELKQVIGIPWINLLKQSLLNVPANSHVFVEIAYGLQPDKPMYNFVGGKVLYLGCDSVNENAKRVNGRNTEHMLPFIRRIPGWSESKKIAKAENLMIRKIVTSGDLEKTREVAKRFADELE
ncbi:MAG: Phosphopantetheine adenylyltransferase [Candidatus Falkowbacteria bacterium GW2011_GWC2_38_22]|uniref:Phosphopantetheine adenylyltransferase n=1 Tax=Candidatus Falkowbacteria bacterium GW2011_GWE1_38_31 TaxID=1618638 RepID=A0A0G0JVC2_9BACT|nr:MAG: Phosphopantetheine adenylyltransferase [Candidatus Falkowbacteria bacterium GW2011_GWF2_38_1205]KKQ61676.1 MAG: Phosphopantetheine adenylyltransferase [Candidatus Falkowbacteria bacterium GW2011_GWC2_38_22]KKQ63709.1 MAG: Phosphopantetheine adenylyltransferase [Candidatus Falkowbacteria bacterium GW2011_GWF1_38_22]KKQ65875.1 MAG: Phosphopantetheine adenylyltransferase [Candidatus Falkowbacteria bacterium GW2011_GWE2_38_254]KKQ70572.1 MAG: Phosphopantetheine adenylyltransferase [Candidat